MLTIKFIKKVGEKFAIYEIPESLKKKYNGNYILNQGVFCKYAVEELEDEEVLENLDRYAFEDIFKTVREAELMAKYADAKWALTNLIASFNLFEMDTIRNFKKKNKEL